MNKLHPQELADLLRCWVAMDKNGEFFAFEENPTRSLHFWMCSSDIGSLKVTHAIAKPDDCPEWDKAIWEPRVMPERGQLCLFADEEGKLTIGKAIISHFSHSRKSEGGYYFVDNMDIGWRYCKPIDSVPARIDLDAQRSE